MSFDPRWKDQWEVNQAMSSAANTVTAALARVLDSGSWREYVHPMRGVQQFDTFADYCEHSLRMPADAVRALLARSQYPKDAYAVTGALDSSGGTR